MDRDTFLLLLLLLLLLRELHCFYQRWIGGAGGRGEYRDRMSECSKECSKCGTSFHAAFVFSSQRLIDHASQSESNKRCRGSARPVAVGQTEEAGHWVV